MKIAVAMSGGVDSSVCAYLLKKEYSDVTGLTFKQITDEFLLSSGAGTCGKNKDTEDAAKVARVLDIPHYVFDYGENFKRDVLCNFACTYLAGETPNPCVECNRLVKFGALMEAADKIGCDKIATGHYARVCKDAASGRYLLKKAVDERKDQSYFLYTLSQEKLSKILFPLGEYTKDEIKAIARENRFESADRPESQDICFIPDGDYAAFIERFTGKPDTPGNFVDAKGNLLGKHAGITHFTIGQGKGLGISLGRKAYVCAIDAQSRNVVLGDNDMLFSKTLDAHALNMIALPKIGGKIRAKAKIRYNATETDACVWQTSDDTIHVEFDKPVRAICPGQSVVIYDGDTVICGAVINK